MRPSGGRYTLHLAVRCWHWACTQQWLQGDTHCNSPGVTGASQPAGQPRSAHPAKSCVAEHAALLGDEGPVVGGARRLQRGPQAPPPLLHGVPQGPQLLLRQVGRRQRQHTCCSPAEAADNQQLHAAAPVCPAGLPPHLPLLPQLGVGEYRAGDGAAMLGWRNVAAPHELRQAQRGARAGGGKGAMHGRHHRIRQHWGLEVQAGFKGTRSTVHSPSARTAKLPCHPSPAWAHLVQHLLRAPGGRRVGCHQREAAHALAVEAHDLAKGLCQGWGWAEVVCWFPAWMWLAAGWAGGTQVAGGGLLAHGTAHSAAGTPLQGHAWRAQAQPTCATSISTPASANSRMAAPSASTPATKPCRHKAPARLGWRLVSPSAVQAGSCEASWLSQAAWPPVPSHPSPATPRPTWYASSHRTMSSRRCTTSSTPAHCSSVRSTPVGLCAQACMAARMHWSERCHHASVSHRDCSRIPPQLLCCSHKHAHAVALPPPCLQH